MQARISDNKIAALDHLRALAITLVFLFHYRLFHHPTWVDTLGSFGWTGVDLFFVLSGYLIASQIFRELKRGNFSLKTFLLKRFFRILPAYWFVLSLYFAVPAFREWENLPPLWKFLSFTQNIGLDLRYQRTFSHAWSLCIEEQFYFLFPLCVLLLSYLKAGTKSALLVLTLFFAGFVFRWMSWETFIKPAIDTDAFGVQWYKWIYYPTYNRLDGLLAGISIAGIAHFFQHTKLFIERYANLILSAGLVLICIAYVLCRDAMTFNASVFGYPLIALSFGCIVASGICQRSILNKFYSRITSAIATLSYAIYLVHKATIHFTQEQFIKLGIDNESSLMFFLSAIVSVAGALMLHYTVEKPFLRIKDRILLANNMPVPVKQTA